MIVSGFPNKIVALQFEWQLQHPAESRIVRAQGVRVSHPKGWQGKLSLLACVLQTHLWKQLNLKLNFICHDAYDWFLQSRRGTSFVEAIATKLDDIQFAKEKPPEQLLEPCGICSTYGGMQWVCDNCQKNQHLSCTAKATISSESVSFSFVPTNGTCQACQTQYTWISIVKATYQYAGDTSDESEGDICSQLTDGGL